MSILCSGIPPLPQGFSLKIWERPWERGCWGITYSGTATPSPNSGLREYSNKGCVHFNIKRVIHLGIPSEHQEWLNAASVHAPWSSSPRLYGQCLNVAWTSLQHVWITNQKSKNPDRNILTIAFKYSGKKSLNMLVLKTEGKKDSDSNLIHEKEENIRKLECFWLTSDCNPENLYRQMLSVSVICYQCK